MRVLVDSSIYAAIFLVYFYTYVLCTNIYIYIYKYTYLHVYVNIIVYYSDFDLCKMMVLS